jgi:hypothetical protein
VIRHHRRAVVAALATDLIDVPVVGAAESAQQKGDHDQGYRDQWFFQWPQ